MSCCHHK